MISNKELWAALEKIRSSTEHNVKCATYLTSTRSACTCDLTEAVHTMHQHLAELAKRCPDCCGQVIETVHSNDYTDRAVIVYECYSCQNKWDFSGSPILYKTKREPLPKEFFANRKS